MPFKDVLRLGNRSPKEPSQDCKWIYLIHFPSRSSEESPGSGSRHGQSVVVVEKDPGDTVLEGVPLEPGSPPRDPLPTAVLQEVSEHRALGVPQSCCLTFALGWTASAPGSCCWIVLCLQRCPGRAACLPCSSSWKQRFGTGSQLLTASSGKRLQTVWAQPLWHREAAFVLPSELGELGHPRCLWCCRFSCRSPVLFSERVGEVDVPSQAREDGPLRPRRRPAVPERS